MKKFLIGIIIIILIHQVFITYKYYTNEPIELTDTKIEDTTWTIPQFKQKIEKEEKLTDKDIAYFIDCFNNPYIVKGSTEGNYLYVDITDGCKSTQARFTIKAKETRHWIIQAEVIYMRDIGFLYGGNCLYDFNIIAFGGGAFGNKEHIGCKIVAQIRM